LINSICLEAFLNAASSDTRRNASSGPDIFNPYADGLERLPHIGENGLLARRIGNW